MLNILKCSTCEVNRQSLFFMSFSDLSTSDATELNFPLEFNEYQNVMGIMQ